VPSESNGHNTAAAAGSNSAASPTANPDFSSLSLHDRADESADLADSRPQTEREREHLDGEQQQHPSSAGDLEQSRAQQVKSADIGHLQARLKAAAKEAGLAAQDMFQRAWMLGPHRVSTRSSRTFSKLRSPQSCIMQSGWLHREGHIQASQGRQACPDKLPANENLLSLHGFAIQNFWDASHQICETYGLYQAVLDLML